VDALGVDGPLFLDMGVVRPGGGGGGLDRTGDHHPRVRPDLADVGDEVAVAGQEPAPIAGHVGPLREGVDHEDPVGARGQRGGAGHRLALVVPHVLHVALVAGHDDPPLAGPGHRGGELLGSGNGSGRVPRLVEPEELGPRRVLLGDLAQVEVPSPRRLRDGHGPQPGQAGTHLVGRVGHRRVQDGVTLGRAEVQHRRQGGHEFFGADAGDHLAGWHRHAETPFHPSAGRLPQGGGADGAGVPGPLRSGDGEGLENLGRYGVARGADRQVDDPTGRLGRLALQGVEARVGVGREHEAGHPRHSTD
jgi:hypothetical protein